MQKNRLTGHCLIKNEEKWVWYAINSVLPYVDEIIVYDTGSTDKTVEIVKSIKSKKIRFKEKGEVDNEEFSRLRQEMLDKTKTPWFMILDGDEIWPRKTIQELLNNIEVAPKTKKGIIVGQWICYGDIFHFWQPLKNFRMTRAIRKTKGFTVVGEYGRESYEDAKGVNISYWDKKDLIFLKNKIFHMSFLPRSSSHLKDREVMMRGPKIKWTLGVPFSKSTKYPEVFYLERPDIVPSAWRKLTYFEQTKGLYYRALNLIDRIKIFSR